VSLKGLSRLSGWPEASRAAAFAEALAGDGGDEGDRAMSRLAVERHRAMDRAFAEAMSRDGGDAGGHSHAILPTSKRLRDLRSMNSNRVPLLNLSARTSKGGKRYFVGWLGRAKVLGFPAAEPDKFGNEQIELYVVEHEPRQREGAAAGRDAPAAAGARPGARREDDMGLDDAIPF
jgi:hypothetical protein